MLRQLEQAPLGAALGGAHAHPRAAPLAEHGAEPGAVLERRHDLRRDRPSPPSSTRAGTPRARRPARGPPRSRGRRTAGRRPRRRARRNTCTLAPGSACERPTTSNASRSSTRADWRSCTWRTAASLSRSSAAFSNSCAAAAAVISRSMSFSTSPSRPRRKSTAWFTVAMYSSRVQRSSHGPSERLMKYCRQGEPLGPPRLGAAALAVREDAADELERLAHLARARERAEVQVAGHAAAAEEAHPRPLVVQRDLDGRVALVVAQAEVVRRALLLDEVVLEEERLGLGRRHDPVDVARPARASRRCARAASPPGAGSWRRACAAPSPCPRRAPRPRRRESGRRRARWGCA